MVKGRRFVLKHHFDGLPKREDFDLVEEELPALKDGDIQIKSLYVSVDPYQRPYTDRNPVPCTMMGSTVSVVEESNDKDYPKGCQVVVYAGWVERAVINPAEMMKAGGLGRVWKIPDIGGVDCSHMLGALGMPGATAYFGFLEICQPKAGQTVVVSGAAGAVGSLVGQIAKIKGCTVIGFAGTDDKVAWLKEIGYDCAYNYKTTTIEDALKEAAPKGVDCYFDNVGGEMSMAVLRAMNLRGRISVCGAISTYNSKEVSSNMDILHLCIVKELMIEGFLVHRWAKEFETGIKAMAGWLMSKKLVARQTIVDGFENTPKAFAGLFDGTNTGKMVVKL